MSDFVDVTKNKQTITSRLRKELIAHEQKCVKDNIPFCYRCAKIWYEDTVQGIVTEALRKNGDVKSEDLKLPKIDFKKFTGKECFNEVNSSEAWNKIKGTGEEKHIGFNVDYKCKIRGCGHTVFMSVEDYNKLKGIKTELTV